MILVTGGIGYIGSHVVKQLLEETDEEIIVIDDLSTGSKKTLETLQRLRPFMFKEINLSNEKVLDMIFYSYSIKTVFHFAASMMVAESVENPLKYYRNNTENTVRLLDFCIKCGVEKFIFSSTAAVYGEVEGDGIVSELSSTEPINPYGWSKRMSEQVIRDASHANPSFKYVIFRYFNVAGADMYYKKEELSPRIGQSLPTATHLINIAAECAAGKREKVILFGEDYPTKDGTCVRDYIHVDDLASAHISAIEYLEKNESDIFNCGYAKGYSVLEVIETMKRVSKVDFSVEVGPRRAGDPTRLIADCKKIKEKMGWKPKYDSLEGICNSAYLWEQQNG